MNKIHSIKQLKSELPIIIKYSDGSKRRFISCNDGNNLIYIKEYENQSFETVMTYDQALLLINTIL